MMIKEKDFQELKRELLIGIYRHFTKHGLVGKSAHITLDRLEKKADYYSLDPDVKNQYKAKEAAYEELEDEGYVNIQRHPEEYHIEITDKGLKYVRNNL